MSYDLNDYTRRNPATSKDSHLAGITSPSTLYTIQQSDTAGWQRQDEYFTRRDEDTPTSAPENDPYHRESYADGIAKATPQDIDDLPMVAVEPSTHVKTIGADAFSSVETPVLSIIANIILN
ncbi:unnamed protein product [Alternaria alternata]